MRHTYRNHRPEPVQAGPGQESVWDYPRPPAVQASDHPITITLAGTVIVDSVRSLRVLETSHPPVHYVPIADVARRALVPNPRETHCEFKGRAAYFDVVAGGRVERAAAWTYPDPTPGYEALRDHVAFYPGRMDRCTLGGETVLAVQGDFYGGWVTSRVVGPFKGAVAGSEWW
jgi:uncharacterized protein (DUF427 family)